MMLTTFLLALGLLAARALAQNRQEMQPYINIDISTLSYADCVAAHQAWTNYTARWDGDIGPGYVKGKVVTRTWWNTPVPDGPWSANVGRDFYCEKSYWIDENVYRNLVPNIYCSAQDNADGIHIQPRVDGDNFSGGGGKCRKLEEADAFKQIVNTKLPYDSMKKVCGCKAL